MKTLLGLLALLVIVFLSFSVSANTLFQYDEAALSEEISEIDELESYVLQHQGITYTEVSERMPQLTENIQDSTLLPMFESIDPAIATILFCLLMAGVIALLL